MYTGVLRAMLVTLNFVLKKNKTKPKNLLQPS